MVGFSTFQPLSCTIDLDFIVLSNSKLEHHPRSKVARAVKAGVKVGNHSLNKIFCPIKSTFKEYVNTGGGGGGALNVSSYVGLDTAYCLHQKVSVILNKYLKFCDPKHIPILYLDLKKQP